MHAYESALRVSSRKITGSPAFSREKRCSHRKVSECTPKTHAHMLRLNAAGGGIFPFGPSYYPNKWRSVPSRASCAPAPTHFPPPPPFPGQQETDRPYADRARGIRRFGMMNQKGHRQQSAAAPRLKGMDRPLIKFGGSLSVSLRLIVWRSGHGLPDGGRPARTSPPGRSGQPAQGQCAQGVAQSDSSCSRLGEGRDDWGRSGHQVLRRPEVARYTPPPPSPSPPTPRGPCRFALPGRYRERGREGWLPLRPGWRCMFAKICPVL